MSLKMIGEIIGFVAIAEGILIFISNKRQKILFYKMISDALWSVSDFLQGGTTAGITCGMGVFREIVFINREKHKWADNPLWLLLFLVISLISPTVECLQAGRFLFRTLLPATGTALAIFGYYNKNPMVMKWISIIANGLYLIYGAALGSVSIVIGDTILILSAVIGIILEKKKAPAEASEKELSSD